MSNTLLLTGVISVVVIAGGLALYYANKKKRSVVSIADVQEENVDGQITLNDVVGVFKQLKLQKRKDTPFITNGLNVFNHAVSPAEKLQKEGYHSILLGVYNESIDTLNFCKVIHCKSFDEKLAEVLQKGANGLVVLQ